MGLPQRAGADGDILYAHGVYLFHYHIDNIISVPEMVVEGEHHAVLQPAFYQNVMYAVFQLASV